MVAFSVAVSYSDTRLTPLRLPAPITIVFFSASDLRRRVRKPRPLNESRASSRPPSLVQCVLPLVSPIVVLFLGETLQRGLLFLYPLRTQMDPAFALPEQLFIHFPESMSHTFFFSSHFLLYNTAQYSTLSYSYFLLVLFLLVMPFCFSSAASLRQLLANHHRRYPRHSISLPRYHKILPSWISNPTLASHHHGTASLYCTVLY